MPNDSRECNWLLYFPSPQRLPRSLRGVITGWGCLSKAMTRAGVDNWDGLAQKADVQGRDASH